MKNIRLSPSSLNLFLDCPRCFWLQLVKNIRRPRGIYPSLPTGMDRVIKIHFDKYRALKKLPPELSEDLANDIKLFEAQEQLDKWRNWTEGLSWQDKEGYILKGAIDDLLMQGDKFIPLDYKTKGSKTSAQEAIKYYQNQLDCYGLLLEENHMPTIGYGFLLYYSPMLVEQNSDVRFMLQLIKVDINIERARKLFEQAVNVIKGNMPSENRSCEYCNWHLTLHQFLPS